MRKFLFVIAIGVLVGAARAAAPDQKVKVKVPNLDSIRTESVNEKSPYYYPRLLKRFMSNDTTMLNDEYRYFYYGTLFQEEYNPYRETIDPARLDSLEALYYKDNHTREEKKRILAYAEDAIKDNPVDLVQLKNLVYVYEKNNKLNLAKIWKNKLNHLIYVIATSGDGHSMESPWIVVYPRHEFDVFNLNGLTVESQEYLEPHYDHLKVTNGSVSEDYYFDLGPLLQQYYLKHPSELD